MIIIHISNKQIYIFKGNDQVDSNNYIIVYIYMNIYFIVVCRIFYKHKSKEIQENKGAVYIFIDEFMFIFQHQ